MEIKFQFTPTKNDYINSLQVFDASPWSTLLIICFFVIMQIYFGNHSYNLPDLRTRTDWYSAFALQLSPLLLAMAVFFLIPALKRMEIRGQVETNEQLRNPVSWQMDHTQVVTKTRVSEIKLDWSVYSRAIEFGSLYLLFHRGTGKMITFIPRRAFESPQHEMEFRSLIGQKLGGLKDEYFQKKILPLRLEIGGIILLFVMMLGYWMALYWKIFLWK